MANQSESLWEKPCAQLKAELDEAVRRYTDAFENLPQPVEPLPLSDVPGGSLDELAGQRAELERLLQEKDEAQQVYEQKCVRGV